MGCGASACFFAATLGRLAGQFALPFAFLQDRQHFVQRGGSDGHLAQQHEAVLAGSISRVQIHQQRGDDRHIEVHQHAVAGVTQQVIEVPATLQPAKEQLDLPAVAIQMRDHRCGDIVQVRDQPERFLLSLLLVLHEDFAQRHGVEAMAGGIRGVEPTGPIMDHSRFAICWRQFPLEGLCQDW